MSTVITSLVAKVGAQISEYNDAMVSAARATHDTQAAMEAGAKAATLLQDRLQTLKQAATFGAAGKNEFATLKADIAELATQGVLAENTTARLAKTAASTSRMMGSGIEDVAEKSLRGEHAASRLSFGLAMMAQSGGLGARGLRGVEMGLMTLLPQLGSGLVAVTAGIEIWHLYTEAVKAHDEELSKFIEKNHVALTAVQSFGEKQRDLTSRINELKDAVRNPPDIGWVQMLQSMFGGTWSGMTPSGMIGVAAAQRAEEVKNLEVARAINQATEARNKAAASAERAKEAAEAHARTIQGMLTSLERERDTYGMTRAEIVLYNLEHEHASAANLRLARSILTVIEAHDKLKPKVAEVPEELRKTWELNSQRIRKADEDYTAAMKRQSEERIRQTEKETEQAKHRMEEIQGVFARIFGDLTRGNVSGAVSALGELAIPAMMRALSARPTAMKPATGIAATWEKLGMPLPDLSLRPYVTGDTFAPERPAAAAGRGPSIHHQSAVNLHISTLGPQDTFNLLKSLRKPLAGMLSEDLLRSTDFMSAIGGNQ